MAKQYREQIRAIQGLGNTISNVANQYAQQGLRQSEQDLKSETAREGIRRARVQEDWQMQDREAKQSAEAIVDPKAHIISKVGEERFNAMSEKFKNVPEWDVWINTPRAAKDVDDLGKMLSDMHSAQARTDQMGFAKERAAQQAEEHKATMEYNKQRGRVSAEHDKMQMANIEKQGKLIDLQMAKAEKRTGPFPTTSARSKWVEGLVSGAAKKKAIGSKVVFNPSTGVYTNNDSQEAIDTGLERNIAETIASHIETLPSLVPKYKNMRPQDILPAAIKNRDMDPVYQSILDASNITKRADLESVVESLKTIGVDGFGGGFEKYVLNKYGKKKK